jgi:hypothetical protein
MKIKCELFVSEALKKWAVRSGRCTEEGFPAWIIEYLEGAIQQLDNEFVY